VQTGWVIAFAGLGLVPFAISQLQIFAFYAMPDTKTPALVNIPVVLLRIGLDLLAYYVVLSATWLAAGLQVGNAISYVFGAVLGFWLLRRRLGRLGMRTVASTLIRLFAAAVPGALLALASVLVLDQYLHGSRLDNAVELVVGAALLVAGYLGAAAVLRVREVTQVWAMVRGRLGR
jgi:putative peptidoglycan lipid II flippase